MRDYPPTAEERAMKVPELMLRAMAKEITWCTATKIIRVSGRCMRRWKERYQQHGYDGFFDRRRSEGSDVEFNLGEWA